VTLYKAPLCMFCTHYRADGEDPNAENNTGSCDAYPAVNGIPLAIWQSAFDHRRHLAGDNGIKFAPKDAHAKSYAARLFKPDYTTAGLKPKAKSKAKPTSKPRPKGGGTRRP
jgi:hypothetical protein